MRLNGVCNPWHGEGDEKGEGGRGIKKERGGRGNNTATFPNRDEQQQKRSADKNVRKQQKNAYVSLFFFGCCC